MVYVKPQGSSLESEEEHAERQETHHDVRVIMVD